MYQISFEKCWLAYPLLIIFRSGWKPACLGLLTAVDLPGGIPNRSVRIRVRLCWRLLATLRRRSPWILPGYSLGKWQNQCSLRNSPFRLTVPATSTSELRRDRPFAIMRWDEQTDRHQVGAPEFDKLVGIQWTKMTFIYHLYMHLNMHSVSYRCCAGQTKWRSCVE